MKKRYKGYIYVISKDEFYKGKNLWKYKLWKISDPRDKSKQSSKGGYDKEDAEDMAKQWIDDEIDIN